MAAITPTFGKGNQGTLTVVAGLDDTYTFQIKIEGHTQDYRMELEDVSGYGDGGDSVWEDTGVLYGDIVIIGRIITNGAVDPASLGSTISSANLKIHGDTVKNASDVKISRMRIQHRYQKNIPIMLWGKTTGTITHTQA